MIRDKSFQLRQIKRLLALTLFFVLQSTLVLGIFYYTFLGHLVEGNAPLLFASEDMGSVSEAVPPLGSVLFQWLSTMLAVNALVTLIIAVYVIRRLGSPVLAIRRALNEIGDGNLGVRLRATDNQEFSELSEALNRALEQVQSKISEVQTLANSIDDGEKPAAMDPDKIRQVMMECRGVLSFFDHTKPAQNEPLSAATDADQDQADTLSGQSRNS